MNLAKGVAHFSFVSVLFFAIAYFSVHDDRRVEIVIWMVFFSFILLGATGSIIVGEGYLKNKEDEIL